MRVREGADVLEKASNVHFSVADRRHDQDLVGEHHLRRAHRTLCHRRTKPANSKATVA